jgi:hypothetical protein
VSIAALSGAVKKVSGGKALTIAFSGYLLSLSDTRLTGSGHLDLASTLKWSTLDCIASPYQYETAAREPVGRLTVHGPVDSVSGL